MRKPGEIIAKMSVASYRRHRKKGPLFVSIVSAGLVAVAYFLSYHVLLIYAALAALTIAAVWNVVKCQRARPCCPAGDHQAQSREINRR